jgi:hypothetical protein
LQKFNESRIETSHFQKDRLSRPVQNHSVATGQVFRIPLDADLDHAVKTPVFLLIECNGGSELFSCNGAFSDVMPAGFPQIS